MTHLTQKILFTSVILLAAFAAVAATLVAALLASVNELAVWLGKE